MSTTEKCSPLEEIIAQGRYTVGEELGRGCWGVVYSAVDSITGESVAIKILDPNEIAAEQMVDRKLSPSSAIRKEALMMTPASNIVPRRFEVAGNTEFIVMPKYEQTLADLLEDSGKRKSVANKGLTQEDARQYLLEIANGIRESHTKLRRAHGDLKLDNMLVSGTNVLLSDFGSATTVSLNNSGSPRDNIGYLYTRAPELFIEGSRPTERSDLWSWGALVYRMYSGSYPLEEELKNDPHYPSNVSDDDIRKNLRNKIKSNLPRKIRPIVEAALLQPSTSLTPTQDLDMNVSRLKYVTKESLLKKDPLSFVAASLTGAAIIGVLAGSALNFYNRFNAQQVSLEKATSQIEVTAEWDESTLEIRNDLFSNQVRVWEAKKDNPYGTLKDFPSKDHVKTKAGNKLSIIVRPKFSPKSNVDANGKYRVINEMFDGRAYIAGYEAVSFGVIPLPAKSSSGGEGYYGGDLYNFQVPKELPTGVHQLIVELYAPKNDGANANSRYEPDSSLKFFRPGKAISRVMIPLVVGNVPEGERVLLDRATLSSYMSSSISLAQVGTLEGNAVFRPSFNGIVETKMNIPGFDVKRQNDVGSGQSYIILSPPNKTGESFLELAIKNGSGKQVSWQYLPVEARAVPYSTNGSLEWVFGFPDREFSEKLVAYRKSK